MDILKPVEKKHDLTALDPYKFASGDNAGEPRRCCRICAGERGLRGLSEPRERLDHLLYRCFGAVVTRTDCLICEGCACQLRTSDQFRVLVEAAFPSSPSESVSLSVASTTTTCIARCELETLTIKPPILLTDSQETIKIKPAPRKMVKERRLPAPVPKKVNVACNTCKQRYPMLSLTAGPIEDFVCSRCKNRTGGRRPEPAAALPRANYEKGDFRKKPRLLKDTPTLASTVKPLLKKCESVIKYHREPRKYQCSQCTQKFMFARRLAEHVRGAHKDNLDNTCVVCSRKFKTQTTLEKHLKIHTGEMHQCEMCMKIFRNKHALQTHYACHVKKGKASG